MHNDKGFSDVAKNTNGLFDSAHVYPLFETGVIVPNSSITPERKASVL